MTTQQADKLEEVLREFVRRGQSMQAAVDEITDADLERAGDMSEPTNVSAPSKAQQHCVND